MIAPISGDPAHAVASRLWTTAGRTDSRLRHRAGRPAFPGHPREAIGSDRSQADRGPQLARRAPRAPQAIAVSRPAARSTIRFTSSAISRDRLSSSAPTVPSVHSNEAMLIGDLEQTARPLVAAALIVDQRRPRAFDDRVGEKLGISKRIRNAVGGQRILEIPGVADERPAATPALTEIPGAPGEAGQWPFAAGADRLRELGRRLMENAQEGCETAARDHLGPALSPERPQTRVSRHRSWESHPLRSSCRSASCSR